MKVWLKLIAFVLIALAVGGEFWSRYSSAVAEHGDAIELAEGQIERLSERREQIIMESAALRTAQTDIPELWSSDGDEPPFGEAQGALASLVSETGAVLKSLAVEDLQSIGSVDAMRVTLEVEADLSEIQQLIQRLHANAPVILPVSAEVRRLNRTDTNSIYPETLLRLTLDLPYLPVGTL